MQGVIPLIRRNKMTWFSILFHLIFIIGCVTLAWVTAMDYEPEPVVEEVEIDPWMKPQRPYSAEFIRSGTSRRYAEGGEKVLPCICPISQSELDLFAALVWSEAGDQPLPEGLCYVADVVLNRVDSPAWPSTITDVIYQPGQFSVVSNGALNRAYGNCPQICYDAVISQLQSRYNYDIIYFSMGYNANGTVAFTHGTHYYSY